MEDLSRNTITLKGGLMPGQMIKQDSTYTVIDNTSLNLLTLSTTSLNPLKETGGHSHDGQEEVYVFLSGAGKMQIDETFTTVSAGDFVLIPDGAFHKVFNISERQPLEFVCVFNKGRG